MSWKVALFNPHRDFILLTTPKMCYPFLQALPWKLSLICTASSMHDQKVSIVWKSPLNGSRSPPIILLSPFPSPHCSPIIGLLLESFIIHFRTFWVQSNSTYQCDNQHDPKPDFCPNFYSSYNQGGPDSRISVSMAHPTSFHGTFLAKCVHRSIPAYQRTRD